MKFGIEKYAMRIMRTRRRQINEGMESPNKKKIKTLGEMESYWYLGILEANTIKRVEIKEKSKRIPLKNEKTAQN